MPATFSRTVNALKSDHPRRRLIWLAAGAVVLGAWLGWFFLAEVPVYESTPSAHLEVSGQAHPVEAPVGGRVVRVRMELGQQVAVGDVLVELDAQAERLRLEETRARISALTSQRAALAGELRAEELAEGQGTQGSQAAVAEAKARAEEAEASAKLAEEEAARTRKLAEAGVVAQAEVERATSTAQQRRSAAEALKLAASRSGFEGQTLRGDRLVRIERLRRQMAELDGTLGTERTLADRLAYEVDRRVLRAPVEGRLGERATLGVGAVVREGDRVATVVPAGELRIVADYLPPAALGRIQPGQPAQARLDGFPWTQFGTISATVSSVASEPRYGRIRVELAVQPDPRSRIPRQHGLTGEVEVEVERTSPAALVLRAVGRGLSSLDRGGR